MKTILMFFIFTMVAMAQDFTGIRIYVNPGHGGHDSDDRYIPATGFWESESNLEKGLYLYELLKSMGATVKISRTTNTSADDLPLSVIDADANNFDADFFHAIHSNGFQGTSNYTVIFYKEVNGAPVFQLAKSMSNLMKNHLVRTNRTTTGYSRGDQSFLGFNLGVLRTLNMPGTLSEGSFHDYIPESYRLMNSKYRKHEAWGILRSMSDYFSLSDTQNGIIAGILRDPTQNVDYYSINGTGDNFQPVNNFTATLLPVGKVYTGDSFNNGFYFFDSVETGDYTIVIDAENFVADTFQVSALPNQSKFYDRYLESQPNYNIPNVISAIPSNGDSSVSLNSSIALNFDIRMNKSSVQSAFSISPSIGGNFIWENNDKKMTFVPSGKFAAGENYSVLLQSSAKSYFGVQMSGDYVFSFFTRSRMKLVDYYPRKNEIETSLNPVIILKFDAPVDASSLSGNIFFYDADDNFVNIFVDQSGYAQGTIKFEPTEDLFLHSEYRVILGAGIGDVEGLNFGENDTIRFTTRSESYVDGNILENFENGANWQVSSSPDLSFGYDEAESSFKADNTERVSGAFSGAINYSFLSDTAFVSFIADVPIDISSAQIFGMWVLGDYSKNNLNYLFTDLSGLLHLVPVAELNFTGWKLLRLDLDAIGFSVKEFLGIQILRTPEGAQSGKIYSDDIQTDFTTGVEAKDNLSFEYSLEQNYPNPFNPSTVIEFSLAEDSFVKIKIYDALGAEITALVDGIRMGKGKHKVNWDGKGYPSGVYFYRIEAGNFVKIRKMLLIR